jgi:hypothetical protein
MGLIALMMEARTSETSISFYQTTRTIIQKTSVFLPTVYSPARHLNSIVFHWSDKKCRQDYSFDISDSIPDDSADMNFVGMLEILFNFSSLRHFGLPA